MTLTRPRLPNTEFQRRRRALMRLMDPNAAAVIPAAVERIRNHDAHYPFRQDSDFLYLTGFNEPSAVLVLLPGRKQGEQILFCRGADARRDLYDGASLSPEHAPTALKVDHAFPYEDLDDILPNLIDGRTHVLYPLGRDVDFDHRVIGWLNQLRGAVRTGARPPHGLIAIEHQLHELRLQKSHAEIRAMRYAADVAAGAHLAAMRRTKPGLTEADIEGELLQRFRAGHCVPAYESIVASGSNACTLHYRCNDAPLKAGDLLLIDAGAEYQGYASDITRTWPVNGRFSPAQRTLYDLVLRAQLAAIDAARAGSPYTAIHDAALRVIVEGLISLKFLKETRAAALKSQRYRAYFPHLSGHWLGLDVHDVGSYRIDGDSRLLEPGMVVTVEPGIYVRADDPDAPAAYRGIGIRIEDDVLITDGEPQVLSSAITKDPAEIEALIGTA